MRRMQKDGIIAGSVSDTSEKLQGNGKYRLQEQYARVYLENGPGLYSEDPITNADEAARIMANVISDMDREYVIVVNVNYRNQPIGYSVVSIGAIGNSLFDNSNILKTAILSNAAGIVVLHNHPSGNLQPSDDDLKMTNRLNVVSKLLGIKFLDHIIVGKRSKTYSMHSHYPDLFTDESINVLDQWIISKDRKTKWSLF